MDEFKLVSPYIFVVGYICYVIIGIFSFPLVKDSFTIHFSTFFFIGVGLGLYILGCQFTLPEKKNFYFVLIAGVIAFYGFREYGIMGLVVPVAGISALLVIERAGSATNQARVGLSFLLLGVLILAAQLIIGGVPIVDSVVRKASVTPLFIFGYSFLFLGLTFMAQPYSTKWVVIAAVGSLGLLSLFTFRVYILELVIAVFVSLYMLKKVKIYHMISAGIPLFLLILVVGYIGVSYQEWKFSPLELFFFRPAFTFGVLNKVVNEAGFFGITHGGTWLQFSSAKIMGPYLFGYESNITSTILGPLIFDGGIAELGVMAFFGAGANTVYRKALQNKSKIPYYSILMGMFLVGVDVSFIPSIILLFLIGLYLVSSPHNEIVKE